MLKQKSIKAIVISLLIILSASCFSLLFTNAYKTFLKENPQAATTYDFASGALTADSYDAYEISNKVGLDNFSKSVGNGLTFSGKMLL